MLIFDAFPIGKAYEECKECSYLERDVPRVFPTQTNIPRNVNGDKVLPDIARLSTLWDASN